MPEHEPLEEEWSLKSIFVPFTTLKAIHWIVIIGLIVYANMLFNGFVVDDKTYIVNNSGFQSLSFIELLKGNVFNSAGQYRPIPAMYFLFLYKTFSNISFFYHFLELILHISNTVLLFLVFRRLFNKQIAFVLSSIFLVHPIQVESVSYIAATDNPLFFLFGIVALYMSFKNVITNKEATAIFSLLLVSLLTKETGVLFLFIILIYKLLFNRKQFSVFLMSGIMTIIAYCIIRFGIGGIYFMKLAGVPIGGMTLMQRIINIPAIIFYYIKTLFIPFALAINQKWVITNVTSSSFYFPLIIDSAFFLLLCIAGFYVYKKNKKAFTVFMFFFLWFLAGLGMHLQLFPLDLTVADRWFYFPLAGLLGTVGIVVQTIKLQNKSIRTIIAVLVVIVITSFSVITIIRNTNWADNMTLYT
ncbi:MAG: hypothetical protein ACREHC_05900, partial [Candidatus Levyibacteriota bacterium]